MLSLLFASARRYTRIADSRCPADQRVRSAWILAATDQRRKHEWYHDGGIRFDDEDGRLLRQLVQAPTQGWPLGEAGFFDENYRVKSAVHLKLRAVAARCVAKIMHVADEGSLNQLCSDEGFWTAGKMYLFMIWKGRCAFFEL